MERKKGNPRYTLVYNRKRNDFRKYNTHVYKPHFLDIIAQRCTNDLEKAKRRVIVTGEGTHIYTPSDEYVEMIKKLSLRKQILNSQKGKKKRYENIKYRGEDEASED